jgi:hypothetical protein
MAPPHISLAFPKQGAAHAKIPADSQKLGLGVPFGSTRSQSEVHQVRKQAVAKSS